MSLTILEVLENAEYNLKGKMGFQRTLGLEQLCNALEQINEYDIGLDDNFRDADDE